MNIYRYLYDRVNSKTDLYYFVYLSMLWCCMLSNSRRNHGLDVALTEGKTKQTRTVFLTAVAAVMARSVWPRRFLRQRPHL